MKPGETLSLINSVLATIAFLMFAIAAVDTLGGGHHATNLHRWLDCIRSNERGGNRQVRLVSAY